jgi:ABC-type cobalt transport system substrate-binding protein
MYPLNMKSQAGGYAVANDEAEHQSLSLAGYEPAFVAAAEPASDEPTEPAKRGPGRPKKAD